MARIPKPDWICQDCSETVPGRFKVCWNCGTSFVGEKSVGFQHADDYLPILPSQETLQQNAKILLIFIFCSCVFFMLLGSRMVGFVRFAFFAANTIALTWLLMTAISYCINKLLAYSRKGFLESRVANQTSEEMIDTFPDSRSSS